MKKVISVLIVIGLLFPNIVFAQTSSKAYLTIKVNVSGVTITINSKSYGEASPDEPILEEFKSGNYKITASKYGYKTDIKNIILQPDESRQISFELALPDKFEIDKDKDKGIIGVEYGSLTIVVRKGGKLVPAKIYVNDTFADNAPTTINKLFVGKHDIKVSYKQDEKYRTINIDKNDKKTLDIELLNFGSLSISTTVDGESVKAKIFLDGEYVNASPHVIKTISEGQHKVRLTYQNYSETKFVKIYPDTEKKLSVDFNPKSEINLTSSISGIKYNVDYGKQGLVPDNVKLKPNSYNFKFSKDGLISAEKEIKIDGFNNYRIIVTLDNNLPNVTANMIGERYRNEKKTINDFARRPEFKKKGGLGHYYQLFISPVMIAIGVWAMEDIPGMGVSFTLGGSYFLYAAIKKKPIKENIAYNKKIPNFVKAENQEAKSHNENIDRLIEDEQHYQYNKNAIKVYEK